MSNVVPMRARAPWNETSDGKLLAQWKWLRTLNADPKVSSAGKHVALYLLDKFDESKGYAYPGYTSIMAANGIGRRAALGAVASLEASGWFRVQRFHEGGEGTGGPRTVNHYYPVWGRAAETSTSAKKALPLALVADAGASRDSTAQCHESTAQCRNEHCGSAGKDTGAVPKPLPDSTDSTYSAHQTTHLPAEAPEASGGGRASAPRTSGSASQRTGILITAEWRPSEAVWREISEGEGDAEAKAALSGFIEDANGAVIDDPDSRWREFCGDWFAPF